MAYGRTSSLSDAEFLELLVHVLDTFAQTAETKGLEIIGTDLRLLVERAEEQIRFRSPSKQKRTAKAGEHAYFD